LVVKFFLNNLPSEAIAIGNLNFVEKVKSQSILDFRSFGVAQDRFWILDSDRINTSI
jgi:hypothetical protein